RAEVDESDEMAVTLVQWLMQPSSDRYVSFFFQAEDGIRDWSVTGVQTCAFRSSRAEGRPARLPECRSTRCTPRGAKRVREKSARSEERRVGKEWRARGAADHEKKKEEERVEGGASGGSVCVGVAGCVVWSEWAR